MEVFTHLCIESISMFALTHYIIYMFDQEKNAMCACREVGGVGSAAMRAARGKAQPEQKERSTGEKKSLFLRRENGREGRGPA